MSEQPLVAHVHSVIVPMSQQMIDDANEARRMMAELLAMTPEQKAERERQSEARRRVIREWMDARWRAVDALADTALLHGLLALHRRSDDGPYGNHCTGCAGGDDPGPWPCATFLLIERSLTSW